MAGVDTGELGGTGAAVFLAFSLEVEGDCPHPINKQAAIDTTPKVRMMGLIVGNPIQWNRLCKFERPLAHCNYLCLQAVPAKGADYLPFDFSIGMWSDRLSYEWSGLYQARLPAAKRV